MNRIYLESKDSKTTEYTFIKSYLNYLIGDKWDTLFEIIPVNGKDNLRKPVNSFRETTDQGFKNIVIFDADTEHNGGGFEKRRKELLAKKEELNIEFDLFLFPNNKDDGDFETLLERSINTNHQCLLDCFHKFENCVSSHKDDKGECIYVAPNRKAMMYTYIESMKKNEDEIKEFHNKKNYFFNNPEYWNLESDTLQDLKKFLMGYLKK